MATDPTSIYTLVFLQWLLKCGALRQTKVPLASR